MKRSKFIAKQKLSTTVPPAYMWMQKAMGVRIKILRLETLTIKTR